MFIQIERFWEWLYMGFYEGVQLSIEDMIASFIPKKVRLEPVQEYSLDSSVCCNCNKYESGLKPVMVTLFLDKGIVVRPKIKMCSDCYKECKTEINERLLY